MRHRGLVPGPRRSPKGLNSLTGPGMASGLLVTLCEGATAVPGERQTMAPRCATDTWDQPIRFETDGRPCEGKAAPLEVEGRISVRTRGYAPPLMSSVAITLSIEGKEVQRSGQVVYREVDGDESVFLIKLAS